MKKLQDYKITLLYFRLKFDSKNLSDKIIDPLKTLTKCIAYIAGNHRQFVHMNKFVIG